MRAPAWRPRSGARWARRPWRRTLALTALLAAALPAQALDVGAPAPAVNLPAQGAAARIALPDPKARLTYVDFWASWCGPCRKSFPWMNQMQARYGAKGLRIVAINVDAKTADAERFLQDVPARFEVALDPQGDSARRYELKGMPTSLLIDAAGRVVAIHQGFRDGDGETLEKLIRTQLDRP